MLEAPPLGFLETDASRDPSWWNLWKITDLSPSWGDRLSQHLWKTCGKPPIFAIRGEM
ncbi:hypothetical protein [Oxynema aestuarii]|uniref:Uncharacterized protein n=1 Tax=Oxynema aestuarii AP17 TaxID=2064643 RepID=A0A6H1U642_9CYAN|nr:hypothetical protein [Oxynema aestuarii]QIZ73099.1 hypothetical protein HCG48_22935 [Oxynema aestuarii AP17]